MRFKGDYMIAHHVPFRQRMEELIQEKVLEEVLKHACE